MNAINLILLSLGLSADAFAVSVSNGLNARSPYTSQQLTVAISFGTFQAAMPILGFLAGQRVAVFVACYAHWVALVLLCTLGGKMILSSVLQRRHRPTPLAQHFSFFGLLMQSVATSMDALSVGIGYAIWGESILPDALCIGFVTFVCCLMGFNFGRRFGVSLADKAMMTGGMLLIIIGIHLFITHYFPFV